MNGVRVCHAGRARPAARRGRPHARAPSHVLIDLHVGDGDRDDPHERPHARLRAREQRVRELMSRHRAARHRAPPRRSGQGRDPHRVAAVAASASTTRSIVVKFGGNAMVERRAAARLRRGHGLPALRRRPARRRARRRPADLGDARPARHPERVPGRLPRHDARGDRTSCAWCSPARSTAQLVAPHQRARPARRRPLRRGRGPVRRAPPRRRRRRRRASTSGSSATSSRSTRSRVLDAARRRPHPGRLDRSRPTSTHPGQSLNVNADCRGRRARGRARRREARRAHRCRRALPRLAQPRLARLGHRPPPSCARCCRALESGMIPKMDGVPRRGRGRRREGGDHRRPRAALDPARDLHQQGNRHGGGARMTLAGRCARRDLMRSFGDRRWRMLVRGEGAYVWDADGRRYLDFLAGHRGELARPRAPRVRRGDRRARRRRSRTCRTTSRRRPQLELAERLKRLAGAGESGRVYFGNSGAEANEAAFKLARLHGGADAAHPRPDRRVPRPHDGLARAHRQARTARAVPADAPGRRAHRLDDRGARGRDRRPASPPSFVEPIKGEAGVVDLPEGYLAGRARAHRARTARCSSSTRSRPAPGARASGSRSSTPASRPTRSRVAKGIGGGVPDRRAHHLRRTRATCSTRARTARPSAATRSAPPSPTPCSARSRTRASSRNAAERGAAAARGDRRRSTRRWSPRCRGRGLLIGVGLRQPVAKAVVAAAQEHGLIINAPNDDDASGSRRR